MPEILIPAPNPESVRAAVQNGADAVYVALGSFGDKALSEAIKYCRIRGAKVYFALPPAMRDSETDALLKKAVRAAELGAAAIETGDIGTLKALKSLLPATPIHFRMGAVNAAGIATAAYLGAARVTLSPDLTLEEITELSKSARIELELPCHGPVCSAAGICRMSAMSGSGCACFGDCSALCRRPFSAGSKRGDFYISRKDICLADEFPALAGSGIAAFRVLGSNRRPEYSALTARIYSAAAKGAEFDREDLNLLEDAFAPAGMTTGFLRGKNPDLLGKQDDNPRYSQTILGDVRDGYMKEEADRIPVRLGGLIRRGSPVTITVSDFEGNEAVAEGALPKDAFGSEETGAPHLTTHLYNLVGSPFHCTDASVSVDRGLYVPPADLIALRRKALEKLAAKRSIIPAPAVGTLPELTRVPNPEAAPDINIYVRTAAQLSRQLAGLKPQLLYIPITELLASPNVITPFWENGITTICAVLPEFLHDSEDSLLLTYLDDLKKLHVNDVMVNELGQIFPAAARGFTVRAGLGLAAYNSRTLLTLKELHAVSVTAPPELKLSEIGSLSKVLPTEAVIYGRVALMHSEADIAAAADADVLRSGRSSYPIFPEYNSRSVIYSSDTLFLAKHPKDYANIGLWCGRLDFTTETAEECVLVAQRYLGQNKHAPNNPTTGLYSRGFLRRDR